MTETVEWNNSGLLAEIERRSGTKISACLQCHKCSTGCPTGVEMDYLPSQIMRLIQLGCEIQLFESRSIWLCASCQACTTRCPMSIDISAVMDSLRIMAVERKAFIADTRSKQFNRSFLTSIRLHGRLYELELMALYKLRSGDLFSDITKVPRMLAKRKLALLPKFLTGLPEVSAVFKRSAKEEKKR